MMCGAGAAVAIAGATGAEDGAVCLGRGTWMDGRDDVVVEVCTAGGGSAVAGEVAAASGRSWAGLVGSAAGGAVSTSPGLAASLSGARPPAVGSRNATQPISPIAARPPAIQLRGSFEGAGRGPVVLARLGFTARELTSVVWPRGSGDSPAHAAACT